jgi:hypothetical protein
MGFTAVKSWGFMKLKKEFRFLKLPWYIKWTWPTLVVEMTSALKPPLFDQNIEALLAAAITELSSMAIGIVYNFPFIIKLGATPKGK